MSTFGPRPDPHLRAALQRASRRYSRLFRPGSWWLWGYAWAKFKMDPVYLQVAALTAPGSHTLDLGSGLAMLPALLAELGEGRSALGLEWDSAKVKAGRRALEGLPSLQLLEANIFDASFPPCDAVVLTDVLHYFPAERQEALLRKAHAALRPGGRLILRETDGRWGIGKSFTRGLERFAVFCGWNRGPGLHFRSQPHWMATLESLGLEGVTVQTSYRLTPGNILIHGHKAAGN